MQIPPSPFRAATPAGFRVGSAVAVAKGLGQPGRGPPDRARGLQRYQRDQEGRQRLGPPLQLPQGVTPGLRRLSHRGRPPPVAGERGDCRDHLSTHRRIGVGSQHKRARSVESEGKGGRVSSSSAQTVGAPDGRRQWAGGWLRREGRWATYQAAQPDRRLPPNCRRH